MSAAGPPRATPPRRAPRLGAAERIGLHLGRRGRFARIDPLVPAQPPSWPKVVGVLAWAGLVGGSLYRAWATSREGAAETG